MYLSSFISLYVHFRDFGLSIRTTYSEYSDDDLVKMVVGANRKVGPSAVVAGLKGMDVRIQRYRIRESLRRIDPAGVVVRSSNVLKRRTYSVKGPNSLWHFAGNHKLSRYVSVRSEST